MHALGSTCRALCICKSLHDDWAYEVQWYVSKWRDGTQMMQAHSALCFHIITMVTRELRCRHASADTAAEHTLRLFQIMGCDNSRWAAMSTHQLAFSPVEPLPPLCAPLLRRHSPACTPKPHPITLYHDTFESHWHRAFGYEFSKPIQVPL